MSPDANLTSIAICEEHGEALKFLTDPFILPGLSFVDAPWVWASSHSDIASQRECLG
jgi:hypothetical protein